MIFGLYKHIKSNQLYNVLGIGRNCETINSVVIYKQLFESTIRNTNIKLPVNSIWVRNKIDFEKKFKKVE